MPVTKLFELSKKEATLISARTNHEIHGDERVFAMYMKFKIEDTNNILEFVSAGLKDDLYRPLNENDDQHDLDGINAENNPFILKHKGLGVQPVDKVCEGFRVTLHRGCIGDGDHSDVSFIKTTIDQFKYLAEDKGRSELYLRVTCYPNEEDAGPIQARAGEKIPLSVTPPHISPEQAAQNELDAIAEKIVDESINDEFDFD